MNARKARAGYPLARRIAEPRGLEYVRTEGAAVAK